MGESDFLFVVRPSTHWLRSTHDGEGNLLYSVCGFSCESQNFPGGAVVENLPANAGDTGSSPGLGRSHMLQSN